MTTRSERVTLAALLALALGVSRRAAQVEVQPRPADRRVDVLVDGKPFTSYAWPERVSKPILYPIRTARGTIVTRGFPLDTRPGERVDHTHQAGYWFTYGDVDGVDFWGNSEAIPPDRAREDGCHPPARGRGLAKSGAGRGDLEVRADWVMPGGALALEETTRFSFRADALTRTIDRVTTLAAKGKVTFRDTKEGMLGIRVARVLEQPADKPEVFSDATGKPTAVPVLDNTGVTGLYTSSEGLKGDAVWGTRARWMALSGRVGRRGRRPAAARPPEEPRLPHLLARPWLRPLRREPVRPEGLLERQGTGASVLDRGRPAVRLPPPPGDPAGTVLGGEGRGGLEGVRGGVREVGPRPWPSRPASSAAATSPTRTPAPRARRASGSPPSSAAIPRRPRPWPPASGGVRSRATRTSSPTARWTSW